MIAPRSGPPSASSSARRMCLVLVLVGVGFQAFAAPNDLSAIRTLIATDPAMLPYRGEVDALSAPFSLLAEHQIPLSLLETVLREGASKAVSASVLRKALNAEAERLLQAKRILEASGGEEAAPAFGRRFEERLKRLSLVLQGGVGPQTISSVLSAAGESGRGLTFCETLLAILQVGPLDSQEMTELAKSVFASSLAPESYRSLPPLFVRARLRGLGMGETANLIERLLYRGFGVIQIEAEIRKHARMP